MKKLFITFTAIVFIFLIAATQAFADNRFNDVDQNAYYYDSVIWAVEEGITDGTTKTTFSPKASCTRGQVVTFLWRSFGRPKPSNTNNPFKDVKEGAYYYDAVLWAVENGITNGTSATTFEPNKTCTQGQILSFLYRSQDEPDVITSNKNAGKYYQKPIAWAEKYGVLAKGFDPNSPCPRADVVTYMNYTKNGDCSCAIDYKELQKKIDEERTAKTNSTEPFKGFKNYLLHKSGEVQITNEELDNLLQQRAPQNTIPVQEAKADVDLYFRALKYGYSGYYYFGEESFKTAEAKIIKALNGKEIVTFNEFASLLQNNMKFVRDGHFSINGHRSTDDADVRYEFYYTNQYFSKDDNGYYQTYYGKKWYYTGCSNGHVEMAPYLTDDGILVYSLVQFCPVTAARSKDSIKLTNGTETKNITINWDLNEANPTSSLPDYNLFNQSGIVYLSIRNYNNAFEDILNQYASDAKTYKNAKLIIYDTRGNGGGGDQYARKWVENLTGQRPENKEVFSRWDNYLWGNTQLGQERYNNTNDFVFFNGKMINNDIPIIFLTDDHAGSAGESVYKFTTTLKNCLVIGTNTNGCQLAGNIKSFSLPYSGLGISFSQNMSFSYNMDPVDGIGYKPDVWCNSKTALGAVMKMLNNYQLANKTATMAILNDLKLDASGIDDPIYLVFGNNLKFTDIGMRDTSVVSVEYKGKNVTDYTFSNSNNDVLTVNKDNNGRIRMQKKKAGKSILTVTIKGKSQDFLITCNP